MPNMNYSDIRAISDQFRQGAGMNRTYRKGDKDNLVHLLQSALYHNGYNLHLNGNYDDATEAAVRAYQRDNGFTQDGIMRPDMLHKLFPAVAPATSAPSMTRPAPAAIPAPVRKQIQAPNPMAASAYRSTSGAANAAANQARPMPAATPIPKPAAASMPAAAPNSTSGVANANASQARPMSTSAPMSKPAAASMPAAVPNSTSGVANANASQARPMSTSAPSQTASAQAAANRFRPRPAEYSIRLNGRNPEAVIRISCDRF